MIKFCRLANVTEFLARYQAWVEFQNLSSTHIPVAVASGFDDDAIHIYQRSEIDLIQADPRPTVGIDLREGLKESSALNLLPKNKHYIIFSGSRPNGQYHLDIEHTLICHDAILADMLELHLSPRSPYFYTDRLYQFDYPKSAVFVTFAGVPRNHRQTFAQWLPELGYSNFIYRMNKQDYGMCADNIDVVDFSKVPGDISQWFESSAQHTPIPHFHILGRIPDIMMNQACFNLVLESDFDYPVFYTTEKTIRPLLMGMPFVLASSPGHLGYLHQLGFKTYGDLWDESYDTITNNQQRLRAVFDLCNQLGKFDWHGNRKTLQKIGQHNRANFANLGTHFDSEFREFERIIKDYERRH